MKFGAKASTQKATQRYRQVTTGAARELGVELYREGEETIAESKPDVPVDTGALRSSGYVALPKQTGSRVEVRCGYGGSAAGYALAVHENLEAHHDVGKAKYLEDVFNRRTRGLPARIAARMEKRLEKK